MLQATIRLTAAQINNLFTTPIAAIPAPGPGRGLMLIASAFRLDYNSIPFTATLGIVACNGALANGFEWGDVIDQAALVATQTTDWFRNNAGVTQEVDTPAVAENVPMNVACHAAIAAGNSTILLTLFYVVVPCS